MGSPAAAGLHTGAVLPNDLGAALVSTVDLRLLRAGATLGMGAPWRGRLWCSFKSRGVILNTSKVQVVIPPLSVFINAIVMTLLVLTALASGGVGGFAALLHMTAAPLPICCWHGTDGLSSPCAGFWRDC